MKTSFLICTHSFVDVITNSSSELFVCDVKKSIDAVKEMLKEMLKEWNRLAEKGYFGSYYVTNDRYNLGGKKIKSKRAIQTFYKTFGDIYVYTKENYDEDDRSGQTGKYAWGYENLENIGKIIITSAEDNSIPSELMDWIETAFNARRYHLG
jgi:hypothetical protein